jgi:alkanesulfonate monooxygenase SsuD/methylene tetrahydromethanopterin reductase-like flavin-dependent oxidoreductase (luciferase family)
MEPLFEALREGANAGGRDPSQIDVAAYVPALVGPRAERLMAQQLAHYVGGMGTFYAEYMDRLGYGSAVASIRSRWEAGDRPGAVRAVPEELLDAATLGATLSQAMKRLAEYRATGIGLPIVAVPHGATRAEVEETLRSLAPSAQGAT